jgi:tripartite-type tricarboxylate transporter receptor subunit TctC
MKTSLSGKWLLVAGACALAMGAAWAQGSPGKPITFVVPFTAGSGTDIVARLVAETMQRNMGQTIVVENRPGAGGSIASAQVARAEADGHTVLIPSSSHAVNPAVYPNLPYDTLRDFVGVTALAALPNVMLTAPGKGYKTVADVVAAAKAKPGQLNYASAGIGSATHLNAEKFRLQAGIEATHVPYRGTPEALADVMGERVDWFFSPLSSALPLIREGKVVPLAVSTATRHAALPNVPTTVEAGVPGSDFVFWVGMVVSAKTPPAQIERLHAEASKALADPTVVERLGRQGAVAYPLSTADFNQFIRTEMDAAARIARAANLKPQ